MKKFNFRKAFGGGAKDPRPNGESGFAAGRSATSPESEQMEQTVTVLQLRNSVSAKQIQDRKQSLTSD